MSRPRPSKLCTCGSVVPHGTACACQIEAKRQRDRRHDARRPNSGQRGYTGEWRKRSREWLVYHPVCVMCGEQASLVDHIQPHRGDPNLFWAWQNWQSLCSSCHNSRKQRIERAAARGQSDE